MSILDDIVNPKNWEFEQNSGGEFWMFTADPHPSQAAVELAQLRLALAERDKTIEEARAIIAADIEFIGPQAYTPPQLLAVQLVEDWLSAHPAVESEEK